MDLGKKMSNELLGRRAVLGVSILLKILLNALAYSVEIEENSRWPSHRCSSQTEINKQITLIILRPPFEDNNFEQSGGISKTISFTLAILVNQY